MCFRTVRIGCKDLLQCCASSFVVFGINLILRYDLQRWCVMGIQFQSGFQQYHGLFAVAAAQRLQYAAA